MFVYLEPRLNAETTSCAGVCHSRVIGSKPQDVSETASGLPPFDHRQLDCFSVVCSSCSRRCSWLAMQVISAQQINRIEFDHTKRVMCTFEPGTYRSYEIHCLCCMHAEDDGPPTLALVLPRVGVELASYEVRTPGVEQLARRVNPLASLAPTRDNDRPSLIGQLEGLTSWETGPS